MGDLRKYVTVPAALTKLHSHEDNRSSAKTPRDSVAWANAKWSCTYGFRIYGLCKGHRGEICTGLKDDLISYNWLLSNSSLDSGALVASMGRWVAASGSMNGSVSDRGHHLLTEVMQQLTE